MSNGPDPAAIEDDLNLPIIIGPFSKAEGRCPKLFKGAGDIPAGRVAAILCARALGGDVEQIPLAPRPAADGMFESWALCRSEI